MNHLTSINRKGDIQAIPLSELYCHAKIENPTFLSKIGDSIKEFGMQNPVVVVSMTIKRWQELKEYNPDILSPPEGVGDNTVFQVRCGNNRVRAARQLGYDTIDCIVVEKMQDSNSLCLQQREQQNKWSSTNQYGKWSV
jgi:ParB-like chromosome segregation protein Spo0J